MTLDSNSERFSIPDHELLRRIGRGSYGEVWLARNIMGSFRAVKIVRRSSFSNTKPFERELSGIRKFEPISRSHDGFINILHVGINEKEGYFYYVMEAGDDEVTGSNITPDTYSPKTLAKELSRRGRLTFQECLQLGLGLSLALHELHKHGLVHRDVKPSNILMVNSVPKLADIGLVAEANEAQSYVGTEGFIPPEGPGSCRADVFSLGKTLYEASTGKDRLDFPEFPTLLAESSDFGQFLELNEVILHACQNNAQSRYQTAWDMHSDLVVLAAGKSVRRLRILERRFSFVKRMAGISVIGSSIIGAAIYLGYQNWRVTIETRERQVGAAVTKGNQALLSGNLLGSLPYYADALHLDAKDPAEASTHRMRLAAIMEQCPKLTHLWTEPTNAFDGDFSPDGAELLVADYYGTIHIHDLKSGLVRSPAARIGRGLLAANYSHDGKRILLANADGMACVLDASSFKVILKLPHPDQVDCIEESPDGRHIVTGCRDGIGRIWNIASQKVEFELKHAKKVRHVTYSRDGKLVATASEDGDACVWNAMDGACLKVLPHRTWVNYVSFSPDGTRIATACADHKARVWDAKSGDRILPDLLHGDGVETVEYSADGRFLLTSSLDGTARLWDARSLAPFNPNPIIQHGERLHHASFAPDVHRLETTGDEGTVCVWDLAGSAPPPPPLSGALSDDGTRYLTLTSNAVAVRGTLNNAGFEFVAPRATRIARATLSHDGQFLAMLEVATNNRARVEVAETDSKRIIGRGFFIPSASDRLALSASGWRLLCWGRSDLEAWNVITGERISEKVHSQSLITTAIFSPDASHCAIVNENRVEILDETMNQAQARFIEFALPVHDAEFSPDGKRIVACCWDTSYAKGYAQVWNVADGRPVSPRLIHGDGVLSASFSSDGTKVVTGSEDFTAIVWDAVTGRQLIDPVLHEEKVTTVAFSPDGLWFVTGSFNGTARVWNAKTGDPLTPELVSLQVLDRVVFLPDGRHVAPCERNGNFRIWNLPVDEDSIADIMAVSRLLSGSTPVRFSQSTSRNSDSLLPLWTALKSRHPAIFAVSDAEVGRWFESQLSVCQRQRLTGAAEFYERYLSGPASSGSNAAIHQTRNAEKIVSIPKSSPE